MSLSSGIKRVGKYLAILFILLLLLFIASLQSTTLVMPQQEISPREMNLAKDKVKLVMDKLAAKSTSIAFNLSNNDLSAISKLGSHLLPATRIKLVTTNAGVIVSSTTELNLLGSRYLNFSCWLIEDELEVGLADCKLGNLPLPSGLLQWFALSSIKLVMGAEVGKTAEQLLTQVRYSNEQLFFQAEKSENLRAEVNNSLGNIGDLAALYAQSTQVSPEVVNIYVEKIQTVTGNELFQYVRELAILADQRSLNSDPVVENTALLWSLAIVFGDYRFSSLIGVKAKGMKKQPPKLRGREDLALHFIYSAILQQLGDVELGLSIGEAKELLDSIQGGSGYSFADLAADKSGLKFAEFITDDDKNALFAQQRLIKMTLEDEFFPYTHDLPEGFRDANYKRVIQSTESENYQLIEAEIDKRIKNLPLYRENQVASDKPSSSAWNSPRQQYNKYWLKVDTHIHTKFSDGNKTVAEVAKQAYNFGCDAIAITDHGDHNLKKVASIEYFSTIAEVQKQYPYMTIIPGLEWNVPPMKGREHVTVLLPKTDNFARNLSAFRARYDHYNRYDEKLLSPVPAFNWLEKYGADNSFIDPVLFYNHPSRKNFQQQENLHDIRYWRDYSDLVVGFSGAPGHQKKRGKNNGSYSKRLKTIDGWDPSVAMIGGEWDRLLQQGYKIWAARAASDFHNTGMDYWPCQFSTTHINALSQRHNDVLTALHSGDFWAQHGGFIKNVDFNVQTPDVITMGQESYVQKGLSIKANLNLSLQQLDWQGKPVNLDELELVIITPSAINSKTYVPVVNNNNVSIDFNYQLHEPFVIFRWRGRSKQDGLHDYMFYTNPIKISLLQEH